MECKMPRKYILTMPVILALFTISVVFVAFDSAASQLQTRTYTYQNETILKLSGESTTKNFKAFCQKYAYAKPRFHNAMRTVLKDPQFTPSQRRHNQISTKDITTSIQWCEYAFDSHAEAYFFYSIVCKKVGTNSALGANKDLAKSCLDSAKRESLHASISKAITELGRILDERKIVQDAERLKVASISKAKYETEFHEKEIAAKVKAQKIKDEGKTKSNAIRAEACEKELKQLVVHDQNNLKTLGMNLNAIKRSLVGKKYKYVAYMLSSTNISTPLMDGVDDFCFQFDSYTNSHKEIMAEHSRLKSELAYIQNRYDIEEEKEANKVRDVEARIIKLKKKTNQEYVNNSAISKTPTDSNDINKLTSYAVIIGRAIGCSINTDVAVNKVTSWLDKRFPPGSVDQKRYLPVFMGGIKYHVENQVNGNSPDNCSTVRREYGLMEWP